MLKWKAEAERLVRESGLPFTILRPSRLTDGPYTSFDLNTLLQGTAGTRRSVQLSPRDNLLGEASRIAVAGAPLLLSVYTAPARAVVWHGFGVNCFFLPPPAAWACILVAIPRQLPSCR